MDFDFAFFSPSSIGFEEEEKRKILGQTEIKLSLKTVDRNLL